MEHEHRDTLAARLGIATAVERLQRALGESLYGTAVLVD
jgi:hypothetical protein